MNGTPRAFTVEEVRAQFLEQVEMYVRYWANVGGKTPLERLEGLAFSIMVILDGASALPGFTVSPRPHESDRAYHEGQGENWYPSGPDADIAGPLHDELLR